MIKTVNPIKNKSGFTLIETMVAIFVLTIGILAIIQAFPLGTNIQKSSQMQTVALELSQSKMEEIISKSYKEILINIENEPYGFDPNFAALRRETSVNYFDPNNPEIVPDEDLGIKKIEVKVFWHSPLVLTEKNVVLATFISKR